VAGASYGPPPLEHDSEASTADFELIMHVQQAKALSFLLQA
jgi:hypothetical protein